MRIMFPALLLLSLSGCTQPYRQVAFGPPVKCEDSFEIRMTWPCTLFPDDHHIGGKAGAKSSR